MHGFHVHTPKISRARLVCLGNKALATRTASFTLLWLKAFLACLVISFLMTSSALRLIPRVKPVSNPLLILLGNFKGFRVLIRPWNPPTQEIRHHPFSTLTMLIIPLVGPKSCQTSPTHRTLHALPRITFFVGVTGLVSFYTVIIAFFSEKRLPTLF